MSQIYFTSHGYKLAGNLLVAARPKAIAFLFIQGWMGRQDVHAAQVLADRGYTSLTYDMRGNGDSEGNIKIFSRKDFILDAETAYDYLSRQVGLTTRICAIGSSFGGYTAVLLSELRNVLALSLRAPANYPDQGFNEPQLAQLSATNDFKGWRTQPLQFYQNHALSALHRFSGKVQIIEAGNDQVVDPRVPKNYAAALADQANLTYNVMPGAPHSLEDEKLQTEYEDQLVSWVSSLGN